MTPTAASVPVSSGRLIIGQPAASGRAQDPTWHNFVTVDGAVYLRENVGVDLGCHGIHYGSDVISGIGGWKRHSHGHSSFRLRDHVRRALRNAQAMGFKGPLPSEDEVMIWVTTQFGLSLPQLSQAQDAYGRLFVLGENPALGVSSLNRGTVCVTTRDLTDYVDPTGISLLFPGRLFRRPSMFMGLSVLKSASNYALAYIWKSVIASWFNCQEVLAMNWKGDRISETTGSIPMAIRYLRNDWIEVRVPDDAAYHLNSITLETNLQLIRARWGSKAIIRFGLNHYHLAAADEIWVMGSWSGLAPVTKVMVDPRFLPWRLQRFIPLDPHVPPEVWEDSVGDQYFNWLRGHFRPVAAHEVLGWKYSTTPGPVGCELRNLFWQTVRQDPEGHRVFTPPADWFTEVRPLEARLD